MANLDTHPLAAEWDYQANGRLTPSGVSLGSGKKVSWVCASGHRWEAVVGNRVRLGAGCSFCTGKRAVQGLNDVLTLYPDLKDQCIEPDKLFEVPAGSKKKAKWKCHKDHVWEASVESRTTKRSGCPYCSGRFPVQGVTDLETTHPKMASEWDWDTNTITPQEVSVGSNKRIGWRCEFGHQWAVSPNSRNNSKSGCPYCSGSQVISGKNDLATLYPQLIAEWLWSRNQGISPSEISTGSSRKVVWSCSVDPTHQWRASVAKRARGGQGCPWCLGWDGTPNASHLTISEVPELLAEWDWEKNLCSPADVSAGSAKRVHWVCQEDRNHVWEAEAHNRRTTPNHYPSGCPYCVLPNSSKRELALKEAISQAGFKVASSGALNISWGNTNVCNPDIYLPDNQAVVEYDGSYWHQGYDYRDSLKTEAMIASGLKVIRVRELPLEFLLPREGLYQWGHLGRSQDFSSFIERLKRILL